MPPPTAGDLVRVAATAALDRPRTSRPLTVREAAAYLWAAGCDPRPCGCDARALVALTEHTYARHETARAARAARQEQRQRAA